MGPHLKHSPEPHCPHWPVFLNSGGSQQMAVARRLMVRTTPTRFEVNSW